MKPYEVILTSKQVHEAWEYHHKVVRKVISSPNYTGLSTPDRFFVGKCGEIALGSWADDHDLDHIDTTNDLGHPDDQDMLFLPSKVTVNIKNSHHPRAKLLLQPMVQRERHTQDYLLGATGERRGGCVRVLLWGAVHDNVFEQRAERLTNMQAPCYAMVLEKLPIRMDEFAAMLGEL